MNANSPFARRLASNDKSARLKAIKSLKRWLEHHNVTELDMRKIWHGLFYCLWLQDKRKDQADLIQRFVDVLPDVPKGVAWLYVRVCWETLQREWDGIDRQRMDKYLSLARVMLHTSLVLASGHDGRWPHSAVEEWCASLSSTLLRVDSGPSAAAQPASGLRFHLIDVFVEELEKVSAIPPPGYDSDNRVPSPVTVLGLMRPFLDVLRLSSDRTLKTLIASHVVRRMLPSATATAATAVAGKVRAKGEGEGSTCVSGGSIPPVPVHVHKKKLAVLLFSMASDEDTPEGNRHRLFSLFRELKTPVADSEVLKAARSGTGAAVAVAGSSATVLEQMADRKAERRREREREREKEEHGVKRGRAGDAEGAVGRPMVVVREPEPELELEVQVEKQRKKKRRSRDGDGDRDRDRATEQAVEAALALEGGGGVEERKRKKKKKLWNRIEDEDEDDDLTTLGANAMEAEAEAEAEAELARQMNGSRNRGRGSTGSDYDLGLSMSDLDVPVPSSPLSLASTPGSGSRMPLIANAEAHKAKVKPKPKRKRTSPLPQALVSVSSDDHLVGLPISMSKPKSKDDRSGGKGMSLGVGGVKVLGKHARQRSASLSPLAPSVASKIRPINLPSQSTLTESGVRSALSTPVKKGAKVARGIQWSVNNEVRAYRRKSPVASVATTPSGQARMARGQTRNRIQFM